MSAVLSEADAFGVRESRNVAQLRVPPHSIEAESCVLGGLLLDNGAWDRVGDLLTESDFYRYEHRLTFAAIGALINATKPADVFTVYEQLQSLGKADEVGGLAYLNSLAQYVPSASNIRRYAEIVRERSILRKLVSASDEIATAAFNTQGKAVDAIVDEAMQRVMEISPDAARDEWVRIDSLVVRQLDDIQARADNPGRGENFIPTGFEELDEILDGGLRDGQFVVIGARPGMGKTAIAGNIETNVAKLHLPVGVFSMEMQNEEGAQRALASEGAIPLHALRQPTRMSDMDWSNLPRAVDSLRNLPIYSNDAGGLNINQIRAKARALKRRHGLRLLVIDYFQLIAGVDPRANRNSQLEEASRGLKALAKELKIPVIALAQVLRSVEKEGESWEKQWPRLSDLKDCGSLEQDADVVMFLMRPCVAQPTLEEEWKHYAKLRIAKQRGGRTGHVHLMYVGENTRFRDWPLDQQIPASKTTRRGGDL